MSGPRVDAAYVQELGRAKALLQDLVKDKEILAGCIRLCIHDAFAYDAKKRVFGANASIRTQKELSHRGNEGLSETVARLADIKSAVPGISFADLYQLAGIVAVQSSGGPDIPFTAGRKDGWSFPPQGAYLSPTTGEQPLKQFKDWIERTGLSVQSATALLGAHSIARWWADNKEAPGASSSSSSGAFSNDYYRQLLGHRQSQDSWLLADANIKKYAESYANDPDAFYEDYAAAHEELSLLGTNLTRKPVDLIYAQSSAPEYAVTATEYAIYAASAAAATGAIAYGAWRWRQRYLRTGRLFSW